MQIKPNTFICSDSIEVLREIQDKAFDLCLTDPPYGIGESGQRNVTGDRPTSKWKNPTSQKYHTFDDSKKPSIVIFEEIIRTCKNEIFFGGNYFTDFLPPSMCWLIWNKKVSEGEHLSMFEMAWTSFSTKAMMFDWLWAGFKKEKPEERFHPTQKPVALFVWCLMNYSKPGDLIIDPFCGSGTTAIACHRTGRRFLCIDKDEEYIKIAQQRYADEIAQQDLFGENQDGALETAEGRGTACNSASMQVALDI
jgi:site-specific DNA-methyltransferase (adenine-specific)